AISLPSESRRRPAFGRMGRRCTAKSGPGGHRDALLADSAVSAPRRRDFLRTADLREAPRIPGERTPRQISAGSANLRSAANDEGAARSHWGRDDSSTADRSGAGRLAGYLYPSIAVVGGCGRAQPLAA